MKTAFEVALDKLEMMEPIPRISSPLGTSWDQPDRAEIILDDTHALMTLKTFHTLHEYSATNPTGVYEGKMWRRHDGAFDYEFRKRGGKPEWLLCWYGRSDKPGFVSNNHRKIILADGGAAGVRETCLENLTPCASAQCAFLLTAFPRV